MWYQGGWFDSTQLLVDICQKRTPDLEVTLHEKPFCVMKIIFKWRKCLFLLNKIVLSSKMAYHLGDIDIKIKKIGFKVAFVEATSITFWWNAGFGLKTAKMRIDRGNSMQSGSLLIWEKHYKLYHFKLGKGQASF